MFLREKKGGNRVVIMVCPIYYVGMFLLPEETRLPKGL